jgi:hypothetical protein
VNAAAHDGSAWANAIVAPVPTTPVRSARAALALDPDLGVLVEPRDGPEPEEPRGAVARHWQRRRGLAELQRAVRDPAVEPAELRRLLRREHWIFGGHLVRWPAAHPLPGETIPLLQFDGALHVISVGRPRVPDLVALAGGQYSLSPLVAAAGERAGAMIRLLDAERVAIGEALGLAFGRALVTVVIGHPDFVAELDAGRIRDEIRALNVRSTGITVMTYEELLTIAERTSDPLPD